MPLLFINPLNWHRDEMVGIAIDFDYDDPTPNDFEIMTSDGTSLPIQVLSDEQVFWMETLKANRKRRVCVLVPVNLPPCGYTTLYAYPRRHPRPQVEADTWIVEPSYAENRYLRLQIADDGGLSVTHKVTNRTYSGLNHFEDVADAGDAYTFCPLPDEVPISTCGIEAQVTLAATGANAVTFQIVHHLTLPHQLTDNRSSRIGATTIEITSLVTLYRDCPYIAVKTTFYNSAKDHKLSVIFPTDLHVPTTHVAEAFAVVERQIDLPDATGWVEDPTPLMHQRDFTDLSDGTRGLAIFNRGLAAIEVTRHVNGTRIAVPLVRAVGWLSRDDLWVRRIAAGPLVPTPGAQCLRTGTYEYAIFPHAGDWEMVYQQAYAYTAPVHAARADTHAGIDLRDMNITRDDPDKITNIPFPRAGELPDTHSFLNVTGHGIVVSALRRSAQATILRFFNITDVPVTAVITSAQALSAAHRLNLNEEAEAELPLETAHQLSLDVRPGQIVTVGFTFDTLLPVNQ
jgi:mannosylglycerate hydrolase